LNDTTSSLTFVKWKNELFFVIDSH
jgi:hypothetical protein